MWHILFFNVWGKKEEKLIEVNCPDQELGLTVAKVYDRRSYAIYGQEQGIPRRRFITASILNTQYKIQKHNVNLKS